MGDTMRGFDIMFIHPKGNAPAPIDGEGALIELVKAPPEEVPRSTRWPPN
jgi:hypothetical protein